LSGWPFNDTGVRDPLFCDETAGIYFTTRGSHKMSTINGDHENVGAGDDFVIGGLMCSAYTVASRTEFGGWGSYFIDDVPSRPVPGTLLQWDHNNGRVRAGVRFETNNYALLTIGPDQRLRGWTEDSPGEKKAVHITARCWREFESNIPDPPPSPANCRFHLSVWCNGAFIGTTSRNNTNQGDLLSSFISGSPVGNEFWAPESYHYPTAPSPQAKRVVEFCGITNIYGSDTVQPLWMPVGYFKAGGDPSSIHARMQGAMNYLAPGLL